MSAPERFGNVVLESELDEATVQAVIEDGIEQAYDQPKVEKHKR